MSPSREPRSLDVYLGERLVGSLTRPGSGRLSFVYATTDEATRLSVSLPVQPKRFPNATTRPFFEGLLPEGAQRTQIARTLGLSEENAYGLLAEIGAECAGAAAVLPRGDTRVPSDTSSVLWLSDEELTRRIADLPSQPLGVDHDVRLSLGGVQEKLLVTQAPDGRLGQPTGGAPSTHIVKPTTELWRDIAVNEAFCLLLARTCGLSTASFELVQDWGATCLVVERFDRTTERDGRILRLHQEDMCQALGRLPSEKYQFEGGPSAAAVIELLRAESATPAVDINTFIRAVAFNYLVGNSHAHGKNFGLLHGEAGPRLTPLYDLVCTAVYPATRRLAMLIGSEDDPDAVTEASWLQLAADCGVNGRLMMRAIRGLRDQVRIGATVVAETAVREGWYAPIIDEIVGVIAERARRLGT